MTEIGVVMDSDLNDFYTNFICNVSPVRCFMSLTRSGLYSFHNTQFTSFPSWFNKCSFKIIQEIDDFCNAMQIYSKWKIDTFKTDRLIQCLCWRKAEESIWFFKWTIMDSGKVVLLLERTLFHRFLRFHRFVFVFPEYAGGWREEIQRVQLRNSTNNATRPIFYYKIKQAK